MAEAGTTKARTGLPCLRWFILWASEAELTSSSPGPRCVIIQRHPVSVSCEGLMADCWSPYTPFPAPLSPHCVRRAFLSLEVSWRDCVLLTGMAGRVLTMTSWPCFLPQHSVRSAHSDACRPSLAPSAGSHIPQGTNTRRIRHPHRRCCDGNACAFHVPDGADENLAVCQA